MERLIPDESLDTKVLFNEFVTDIKKVSWEIWALAYLCLLLPSGRFVKTKYMAYQQGKKVTVTPTSTIQTPIIETSEASSDLALEETKEVETN
jgi:hypothetical protein